MRHRREVEGNDRLYMNQGTVLNKKTQYYAFYLFYSISIRCTLPFTLLSYLLTFCFSVTKFKNTVIKLPVPAKMLCAG
jgi:hypothetical protein